MSNFENTVIETSKALGISEKDALTLEFISQQAFADLVKDRNAEAIFHVAAKHSAGQIDKIQKEILLRSLFAGRR